MRSPLLAVLAAASLLAAASAKGGGQQPAPPPPSARMRDSRSVCDPCSQAWAERTEQRSYAGIDMRQTMRYDGSSAYTPEVNSYADRQIENWGDGSTTASPFSETCSDVTSSSGGKLYFDLPCVPMADGAALSLEKPVYCDDGVQTPSMRSVHCSSMDNRDKVEDGGDATVYFDGYMLPCDARWRSNGDMPYTAVQTCCRCGGGTYASPAPPPPAPPPLPRLATPEAMCLALPGCCYDADASCQLPAAPVVGGHWENGEIVQNDDDVELAGCCFSPEWRAALGNALTQKPEHVATSRFTDQMSSQGASDFATATCTDEADWPSHRSSWMGQAGSVPGVNLVLCHEQPDAPDGVAPGYSVQLMAAGGSLWVLWFLYQCIGQPITGSVYLCCMDKKREGKEPDCPKAAAIIIGGTCLCCAPCICGMICAGALPPPRVCARTSVAGSHSDCSRLSC